MSNEAVLEQERDDARRELIGVQEMLAFVLQEVGKPVVVSKEALKKGLPENTQIAVDDEPEGFVFHLVAGA
jgi:hypothetical protein